MLGVFSDRTLGLQLRKAEDRWRRGEVANLREVLEGPVAVRYGSD